MHRIDGEFATVDHKFTEGDPATGVRPTQVTDDWLNDVQENISKSIEDAGITLVKGDYTQLSAAIQALADVAVSAGEILTKLKTVDGAGSGLDTDTVRGTTPGVGGLAALAKAATIWASDNDGAGTGLEADTVPGYGIGVGSPVAMSGSYNSYTKGGAYADSAGNLTNGAFNPSGCTVFVVPYSGTTFCQQIAFDVSGNRARMRSQASGTWSVWTDLYSPTNDAPIARVPQQAAGRGQWIRITPNGVPVSGDAAVVPAGGTWAYWLLNTVNNVPMIEFSGIAAGGTTVGTGIATYKYFGFCWRIS